MAHPTDDIVGAMRSPAAEDRNVLQHAYDVAEQAHGAELRKSGEPYIVHPHAIALNLAKLGMDRDTIVAGILHDTVEDTALTADEIEKEFGADVRFLVEGVTKLSKLKYRGLDRHIESLRRLLIATAADTRVIVIKLADRLHNMETIHFVAPEKQYRIAAETMKVYVPIAERLNIGLFKTRLEDLAYEVLSPKEYAATSAVLEKRREEMESDLEEALRAVKRKLAEAGVRAFHTETRVKGVYSFAQKLMDKSGDVEQIFDVLAIRIIVPTVEDCYRVLGIVHGMWTPIKGRIKDYIALPKANGYQSLHTAVTTPKGVPLEIQIRTDEMHRTSLFGAAAHFAYKYGHTGAELTTEDQGKFFKDRIFVFTPRADVIDLPKGATAVDFAYAIHSSLGDNTVGAKANGKMLSLDTPLKNGDMVEILTKKSSAPNKKWIDFAKTTSARKHIRHTLKKKQEK